MGAKIGVLLNCGQQSQFSKVRREFDAGRVNLDPPMTCADWPVPGNLTLLHPQTAYTRKPLHRFYEIVRRSIECVSFVWNYIIIMKVRLTWAICLFISIIISCLQWLSATARIHASFLQCRPGSVSLRNVSSSSWCGSGRMWLRRTYKFCFPGVTVWVCIRFEVEIRSMNNLSSSEDCSTDYCQPVWKRLWLRQTCWLFTIYSYKFN